MLDDEKHGTIGITFHRDDGAKKEANALIHEKDFDEFLKVLEQVDFKNWENKYGSYENKIDYEMLKKYNPKQIGSVVR